MPASRSHPVRRAVFAIVGLALAALFAWSAIPNRIVCSRFVTCCSKANSDLMSIEAAVRECTQMQGGCWPESLEPLVVPDADGHTFLDRRTLPLDPWKRPYRYSPPCGAGTFRVRLHARGGR